MRGKSTPPNKKDVSFIEIPVRSFNPQLSHYRREHAPNRLYLPQDLSIKFMHSDYNSKNPNKMVSYELYRKKVNDLNISFAEPELDMCDKCAFYEVSKEDSAKEEWKLHLELARKSCLKYRADFSTSWPKNTLAFAVDMQKVLLLPYIENLKSSFFTSRLVIFNETFAQLGIQKEKQNQMVIWNESVARRKKEDVASAFHYLVR